MKFTELIIREFGKNYVQKAQDAYNIEINQWSNPLYNNSRNGVFDELKKKYENKVKCRKDLIKLYKKIDIKIDSKVENKNNDQAIYDAFLCAMVWGKIGLISKKQFFDVFDKTKKYEIITKLKAVNNFFKEKSVNCIIDAFKSMASNGDNKITSVDTSYFTKYLYFLGETIWDNNEIRPLIYDGIMQNAYKAILITEDDMITKKTYSGVKDYEDYLTIMQRISVELKLTNSGYLEALLFSEYGRIVVKNIIKEYTKEHPKYVKTKKNKSHTQKSKVLDIYQQYAVFCKKAIETNRDDNWVVVPNNPLGLRTNIFVEKFEYHRKTAYQSFSIIGYKNASNKDNIKQALDREFAEELSNTTTDYKEVRDFLVIYNHNPICVTNGKLNEGELIKWFNAHAENLIKIIDDNK